MVKTQEKPKETNKNPLNKINLIQKLDSKLSKKSRQEINRENYQKRKEQRKEKRKERYQQQKIQAELSAQQQLSKYYEAEAINILMSFKEYTELNKEKKHLWLEFNWTLKDCREAFQKGFGNVVAVMKLVQVADKLVRDYWATAKSELKTKGKSWNVLSQEKQDLLIKYWAREKARVENGYLDEEERLQRQSQEYLQEIELAKFHEERGKIKCSCWSCENRKEIQKELEDYDLESRTKEKEQCPECGRWVRELDDENGLCKRCMERYK